MVPLPTRLATALFACLLPLTVAVLTGCVVNPVPTPSSAGSVAQDVLAEDNKGPQDAATAGGADAASDASLAQDVTAVDSAAGDGAIGGDTTPDQ